jgi:uncharacterized membrane protein YoaK (UPF0700 family)
VARDQGPERPQNPARPDDQALPQPSAGPGTPMPPRRPAGPGRPEPPAEPAELLAALLALTLVSGLVDAVSYLGLGHVFTANMTGNVVVLGFAAAGAPGFSATGTLTSLGVFLVGAVAGGRLAGRVTGRGRLLLITMIVEALVVGTAALIALLAGTAADSGGRLTVIAVLALAMGMRNAAVRRLAVRDLTTTVLTLTLTGLATDSSLAGGTNPGAGRRVGAVVAMLIGAVSGALMYRHINAALPLLVAASVTTATAIAFGVIDSRARPHPGLGESAP